MLKDRNSFAILMYDNNYNEDLMHIIQKMSEKRHIGFNRCKLNGDNEYSYVLYDIDKNSLFTMARNKKLKLVWKDDTDFYVIDFKNNTKEDIISYLTTDVTDTENIEGNIITPNLKLQFRNMKKIQLVSGKQLDDKHPQEYEHFCFYLRKFE